jgi:hypothetical protein
LSLATEGNGSEAVLAAWVEEFSLSLEGPVATLHLKVERPGQGPTGKETYRLDFSQFLRNS